MPRRVDSCTVPMIRVASKVIEGASLASISRAAFKALGLKGTAARIAAVVPVTIAAFGIAGPVIGVAGFVAACISAVTRR